jgi:hypothetical protein
MPVTFADNAYVEITLAHVRDTGRRDGFGSRLVRIDYNAVTTDDVHCGPALLSEVVVRGRKINSELAAVRRAHRVWSAALLVF